MVTKVLIYRDAIYDRFIAIYVNNDGKFEIGPFSKNIRDLAKELAEQLNQKTLTIEDQQHIVFPSETLLVCNKKPRYPSVYFFENIKDFDLKHDFFSSFQKTNLDLMIRKAKIPA